MLSQEDDGPEADTWFTRGNGSSSSVISWLQLSDFFSHLHMHNLCITAALQGLRLISDTSPHSFRLRLCLHVSESHSNLGNVNESIRFMNVAVQDIRSHSIRSKRRKDKRASIGSNPVEDDVSTLTQAFERYILFLFQPPHSYSLFPFQSALCGSFRFVCRYQEKSERLMRWKYSLTDSSSVNAESAEQSNMFLGQHELQRTASSGTSRLESSGGVKSKASYDSLGRRMASSPVHFSNKHDNTLSAREAVGIHISLLAQIAWTRGNLKLSMICCMQITGKRFVVADNLISDVRLCTCRCLMDHGECGPPSLTIIPILRIEYLFCAGTVIVWCSLG
jgi:hypothetical protein